MAVSRQDRLGELVGASERMREPYGMIRRGRHADHRASARRVGLWQGVMARTLHALSGRTGPLVVFRRPVTEPEMVRNDLFGHIKGAFTGATGSRGRVPPGTHRYLVHRRNRRAATGFAAAAASECWKAARLRRSGPINPRGWTCASSPLPTVT